MSDEESVTRLILDVDSEDSDPTGTIHEIARLVGAGFTSGYEPTWSFFEVTPSTPTFEHIARELLRVHQAILAEFHEWGHSSSQVPKDAWKREPRKGECLECRTCGMLEEHIAIAEDHLARAV